MRHSRFWLWLIVWVVGWALWMQHPKSYWVFGQILIFGVAPWFVITREELRGPISRRGYFALALFGLALIACMLAQFKFGSRWSQDPAFVLGTKLSGGLAAVLCLAVNARRTFRPKGLGAAEQARAAGSLIAFGSSLAADAPPVSRSRMSQRPGSPPGRPEEGSSVVVYRTGFVHELDMVADAMSRAGIPYFRRVESIGGLSVAMPVMPAGGPGTMWAVGVPETWADRAKHFISKLPVPQGAEPHVWSSAAPPQKKESSFYWAWVFVIGAVLLLVWSMIRAFTE